MSASIRDVAIEAGVSAMTVSNVLKGRDSRATPETRERVLRAVRKLEYAPVAQPTIKSRRVETRTISLAFDSIFLQDVWGLPTYQGMCEAARPSGYDLLTLLRAPADWMVDQEQLAFLDRRSDGFVFVVPQEQRSYQILQTLLKHKLPVVACYTSNVPPGIPAVVLDNAGAMEMAVQHLVGHGHEHILHLTNLLHRSDFAERREGFEGAMQQRDLEPFVLDVEELGSPEATADLIGIIQEHAITAIACASDHLAAFAWNVAEAQGLKIPQDLSITGMDNFAHMATRGLTSIQFPCEEVGRRAIEILVNLINGGTDLPEKTVVPVNLMERSSVAAPPEFSEAAASKAVFQNLAAA